MFSKNIFSKSQSSNKKTPNEELVPKQKKPNTKQILEKISGIIKSDKMELFVLDSTFSYNEFSIKYRAYEEELVQFIDKEYKEFIPLKNDAVKKLFEYVYDYYPFEDKENYNTKEILEATISVIKVYFSELCEYQPNNYKGWEEKWNVLCPEIEKKLPSGITRFFPLKEDLLKLIIADITEQAPFDRNYVLKNYEKKYEDIEYLVYPSKNPVRALIFFSGFIGRKTYNRYSWYWDEEEKWEQDTLYIFLNDVDNSWYVGKEDNPKKEKYKNIIMDTLKDYKLTPERTFAIGGSMGGYASLLFSYELGLKGCLSIAPQLTYKDTKKYHDRQWEINIKECGSNFVDISDLMFRFNKNPMIFLEHGEMECDLEPTHELIRNLRKREVILINRKTANKGHLTNNPSRQTVDNIIRFFESHGFDDEFIK